MTTVIPAADADSASAAAARIVLENVSRSAGAPDASASFLTTAIAQIYGAVWNRAVIGTVATDPINKLMQRLRYSPCLGGSMVDRPPFPRRLSVPQPPFQLNSLIKRS